MSYLLDTDHITIFLKPAAPEHAVLAARMALHSPADFCFSSVSLHEQFLGAHAYIIRARTTHDVLRGYAMVQQMWDGYRPMKVVPFDASAGATFDRLRALRLRVGTLDLRIASIALSRGLTVLTRNSADFGRVPGLAIEDWTI
jgi:tRNA(fMet)-specific endonuclease VapC